MDFTVVESVWGTRSASINVPRGEEFNRAAEKLSNFVRDLPLTTAQNDELVRLAVEMTNVAEHGAYLAGFEFGFRFGRDQSDSQ